MGDGYWTAFGLASALIDRRKTKKAIKTAHRSNIANRGLTQYRASDIEAFFSDTDTMGNVILSGGNPLVRARAFARAAEYAAINGFIPVIFHGGNAMLEAHLQSYFGPQYLTVINRINPYYEPLQGLNNAEISRLFMQSISTGYEIKGQGMYYINGMSDTILQSKQ